MAMASSLIVLARALKWALNAVRAAGKLHDDLLDTVMRLPMSFFGAIERAHRTQPPIEDRLCFDHFVLPCFLTNVCGLLLWLQTRRLLVGSSPASLATSTRSTLKSPDRSVRDHSGIIYSTFFATCERLSND